VPSAVLPPDLIGQAPLNGGAPQRRRRRSHRRGRFSAPRFTARRSHRLPSTTEAPQPDLDFWPSAGDGTTENRGSG